jgi:hypothetical protein
MSPNAIAADRPGLLELGTEERLEHSLENETTTAGEGPGMISVESVGMMEVACIAGDSRATDTLLCRFSTTTGQYCRRAAGTQGFHGTNSSPVGVLTSGSMRMGFSVRVGGEQQATIEELRFGSPILWKIETVAHKL